MATAAAAAGLSIATASTSGAQAQTSADMQALGRAPFAAAVTEAAQRFGVPARWIYAVIDVESGGDPNAISSAGAMGLMQLMPETWARERARLRLGNNPFDPRDNILAGADYLRAMYARYGAIGMLAAYNAGPGRYEAYRRADRALPAETLAYVRRLAPVVTGRRGLDGATRALAERDLPAVASVFVTPSAAPRPNSSASLEASPNALAIDVQSTPISSQSVPMTSDRSALYPQGDRLFAVLDKPSS